MARSKHPAEVKSTDAAHKAAGVAAAMLVEQMQAVNAAVHLCLAHWHTSRDRADFETAEYYFQAAMALSDMSAKLAGTVARMRGESHQRISVERLAVPPRNAPDDAALSPREALKARANPDRSARRQGEGDD
jgi:hypothetical protein